MQHYEGPHTSQLQTYDHHPKHHLTQVHTPLLSHLNRRLGPVMYEIKIKNRNITKPCAEAFHASLSPHKLSLPAQLVLFLCKVTFILKSTSLGLCSSLFFFVVVENSMFKQRSVKCPTGFSHLWLTRPIRLLFTDIHFHLLCQATYEFTSWAHATSNLA